MLGAPAKEESMQLAEPLDAGPVRLRRLELSDRDALAAAVRGSVEALAPWMPWAHPGYGPEEASTFLANAWLGWQAQTSFEFAVVAPTTGELLGLCGLNQRAGDSMNLGYWVRTSYAGHGVATAAARRVARFGFEHVGLRRITLYHAIDNVASGRVAAKVGFTREGHERARLLLPGGAADCLTYGLLASEWPGLRGTPEASEEPQESRRLGARVNAI
jgi:RimJ/RimL family protein N-acetyltransferase